MTALGFAGIPGQGALSETTEREILWGGDDAKARILVGNAVVSGAARDAANTVTTELRPGLLMGTISASGKRKEWNPDGTDGSQYLTSVNWKDLQAQYAAANTDRAFSQIIKGCFVASQLLIEGVSLVGHTDEYLARRMLAMGGSTLDDDPYGYKAGVNQRLALVTGTSDTLTADENGTRIFYDNAASVTVTLPALKAGLIYELVRVADEEFVVASAEGDNMIVGADLSADSVTFTTASQQIGAIVRVEGVYVGTTLKWLVTLPPAPYGTGTATLAYSIAS